MKRKKKICLLCEYLSYVGGGERVYCSWANMMATDPELDVTIVAMEKWDKPFYQLNDNVKVQSLNLRPPKFYQKPHKRRLLMVVNYLSDVKRIQKYLISEGFDIVIGVAVNINLILANISGPFIKIATEHSEFHAPNKLIQTIRNRLYKKFDKLTVLNKFDQTLFQKYNKNTIVVPNPVEALVNRSTESSLENKIILSIGSLSPQKNQSEMIEIMRKVHEKHPSWKLKIYGEGPLKHELCDQIFRSKSNDYISLEGVTNNVNEVLSDASIFILTSKIEGFGLVLIEAMGNGLPCVSYRAYGPESIINNGFNGFIIDQKDQASFVDRICQLIEDEELRKRMGNNAYGSVGTYRPEKVAELWKEILDSFSIQ